MTQPDFVRSLEATLARRGLAFEQGELAAWVASAWQRVAREPDTERWAAEFLEARAARTKERPTTTAPNQAPRRGRDNSTRLWIAAVAAGLVLLLWWMRRS